MKYIQTLAIATVFSLALTASAHNGVDHSKGQTHEEERHASGHMHDDPIFSLISNVIFGAGFVISGGIVARDMKQRNNT